MTTYTVGEAKTHLSRILERVRAGEVVVIARGKTPVARLVPIDAPPAEGRVPGVLKHLPPPPDDFFAPLEPEELGPWQD